MKKPSPAPLRRAHPGDLLRFPILNGDVLVDPREGCPVQVTSVFSASTSFLSGPGSPGFQAPFRWGCAALVINGARGLKWGCPAQASPSQTGITLRHEPREGIALTVKRRFARRWTETYVWQNVSRQPVSVSMIGLRTPFNDAYFSAAVSLRECCHAHIFPGGGYGHVWASPMDGGGSGLGLRVTQGEIWAYSVEGRNHLSSSNYRGNIVLHPTDAARAPHAFGGQPVITIEPGAAYILEWEIGVYKTWEQFASRLALPAEPDRFNAPLGEPITLRLRAGTTVGGKRIRIGKRDGATVAIRGTAPGETYADIAQGEKKTRYAFHFHAPIRQIVEQRIDFVLAKQRAVERESPRNGAFLPLDTQTGLTIDGGEWHDWSDARERLAMPALLQQARFLNWGRAAEIDAALAGFSRYAATCLLGPDGEAWENSYARNPKRLYNYPWLSEFFLDQYRLSGDRADLHRAAAIAEAYYRLGGDRFLAFWREIPELLRALRSVGETARAQALAGHYAGHAKAFLARGADIPAHEVNYEQSIVAPLALLYLNAHSLFGDAVYLEGLHKVMPWLAAFGGRQPHCRLRHIPIRHWDGFWFGRERLWGDVFPHYWSVLSASVFLRASHHFPKHGRLYRAKAREIYLANLLHFDPDGGATCAFVFPSAVDGRPGHVADPLANDQDWALVWLLRDAGLLGLSLEGTPRSR